MLRFVIPLTLACVTNAWASGVSGLMTAVKRGKTKTSATVSARIV